VTDQEISAMAHAVRDLLDQRDIGLKAQLADARASVEALQTELQELRAKVAVLPGQMSDIAQRMVQTIGTSLGDALPGAVQLAAERTYRRMVSTSGVPSEPAP
jgi:hypothetical protein